MGIERERGISVVTSVMTFEHAGCVFNLLDTPGHEDFSEDTYRTLTAVDAAVMVIDAAKGIEARTRKLFEICRLRDIPILTFINKMDRESQDSVRAAGRGLLHAGAGHRAGDLAGRPRRRFRRHLRSARARLPPDAASWRSPTRAWPRWARRWIWCAPPCRNSRCRAFMAGHLTPVFFGSAMKEIGVADLLDGLAEYGPPPARPAGRHPRGARRPRPT